MDLGEGFEFLMASFFTLTLWDAMLSDSHGMCRRYLLYIVLEDGASTSACRASNLFLTAMVYWSLS